MADAPEKKKEAKICLLCKGPETCPTCETQLVAPRKGNTKDPVPDIHNQLPPYPSPAKAKHPSYTFQEPPEDLKTNNKHSVFLAGSIEMGAAVQWQVQMDAHLQDLPLNVYNPRRGVWDPAINPAAEDEGFRVQVNWELNALEAATIVCFFFDHNTVSPVTMLELGLWAATDPGKIVVCCNSKFWKAGNVQIVCGREEIPLVETFVELEELLRARLRLEGLEADGMPSEEEARALVDAAKKPRGNASKLVGTKALLKKAVGKTTS
jgi:hypothetical protein